MQHNPSQLELTLHSATDDCPGCRQRQRLLQQAATLADRYRRQAEAARQLLSYYAPKISARPIVIVQEVKKESRPRARSATVAA